MPSHDLSRRLFLGSLGATLALPELRARAAQAPAGAAPAANVEKDVVYGKGGDTDLHLDIYKATGANSKRMAVIHFHGGGFAGGNKDGLAARLQTMSARGYVNIAAHACRRTARRGVAVADRGREGIDPLTRTNASRLRHRSGRVLRSPAIPLAVNPGAFAAGTPNMPQFEGKGGNEGVGRRDVAACLAYYAVTGDAWEGFRRQFPMPDGSSDEAWRAATPGTYIKNFPPTILFHGLADVTVPPESSMEFLKQLRGANIPSELHTYAGVPHEFVGIPEFAESTAAVADFFLERHVINPKTYPAFGAGRGGGGRGGEAGREGRQ
jgi:acetyl esterase/lipase